MSVKQFLREQSGATSVIGILLLVAITVIVGAVAGVYALNVQSQTPAPAPETSFSWEYVDRPPSNGDYLNATIRGTNDPIPVSQLKVVGEGEIVVDSDGDGSFVPTGGANPVPLTTEGEFSGELDAGDSIYIGGAVDNTNINDETIRIVWTHPESDTSITIGEWTGQQ